MVSSKQSNVNGASHSPLNVLNRLRFSHAHSVKEQNVETKYIFVSKQLYFDLTKLNSMLVKLQSKVESIPLRNGFFLRARSFIRTRQADALVDRCIKHLSVLGIPRFSFNNYNTFISQCVNNVPELIFVNNNVSQIKYINPFNFNISNFIVYKKYFNTVQNFSFFKSEQVMKYNASIQFCNKRHFMQTLNFLNNFNKNFNLQNNNQIKNNNIKIQIKPLTKDNKMRLNPFYNPSRFNLFAKTKIPPNKVINKYNIQNKSEFPLLNKYSLLQDELPQVQKLGDRYNGTYSSKAKLPPKPFIKPPKRKLVIPRIKITPPPRERLVVTPSAPKHLSYFEQVYINRMNSALQYLKKYDGCYFCKLKQCDKTLPYQIYKDISQRNPRCKCLQSQTLDEQFDKVKTFMSKFKEDTTQARQEKEEVTAQIHETIDRIESQDIVEPQPVNIDTGVKFKTLLETDRKMEALSKAVKITQEQLDIGFKGESSVRNRERRVGMLEVVKDGIGLAKNLKDPDVKHCLDTIGEIVKDVKLVTGDLEKSQGLLNALSKSKISKEELEKYQDIVTKLNDTATSVKNILDTHRTSIDSAVALVNPTKSAFGSLTKFIGVIMGFFLYPTMQKQERILFFFNQIFLLNLPESIGKFFYNSHKLLFERQAEYTSQSDFASLVIPSAQFLSLGLVASTAGSNSQMVTKVIKAGNIARSFTNVKNMTDVVKVSLEQSQKTIFESVTGLPYSSYENIEELEPLGIWMDLVQDTIENPEWMAHYLDDPENAQIVDDIIAQGETVLNSCLKDVTGEAAKLRGFVKTNLDRFKKISLAFKLSLSGNKDRALPVSILFYGAANTGKTYTTNKLTADLFALQPENYRRKFKHHENLKYTKPKNSEYFSGYNGQFVYMEDELFQIKTDVAKSEEAANVFQFIQETSAPLNQAELELKGRIHFTSKYVMYTTNLQNFDHIPVQEKNALVRRFHYCVRPIIKDRFRNGNGFLNLEAWENYCLERGKNSAIPNYAYFIVQKVGEQDYQHYWMSYSKLVKVLHNAQVRNEFRFVKDQAMKEQMFAAPTFQEEELEEDLPYSGGEQGLNFFENQAITTKDIKENLSKLKDRLGPTKNDNKENPIVDYYADNLDSFFASVLPPNPEIVYTSEQRMKIYYYYLVYKEKYDLYLRKDNITTDELKKFIDRKQYDIFAKQERLPNPGMFKFGYIKFISWVKKHPIIAVMSTIAVLGSLLAVIMAASGDSNKSLIDKVKEQIKGTNESKAYQHAGTKNKLPNFTNAAEITSLTKYNNIAVTNKVFETIPDDMLEFYNQAVSDHNLEAQLGKILMNTVVISVDNNQVFITPTRQKGIILCPGFLLVNTHLFEKFDLQTAFVKVETHSSTFHVQLKDCELSQIHKKWVYQDATIIKFPPNKLQGFNIVSMFATSENITNFHDGWGELIVPDGQSIVTRHSSHIKAVTQQDEVFIKNQNNITMGLRYQASTKNGDCGSPLVRWDNSTSGKILGIHSAGGIERTHEAYAVYVDREWIEEVTKTGKVIMESKAEDLDPIVHEGHEDIIINQMRVLGKAPIKTTIPLGPSSIVPSDFQRYGFAQPKEAPVIRTIRGIDSSLAKVLRKFRNNAPLIDTDLLHKITYNIAIKYFSQEERNREIYTPEEALNILGSINSIDMSTSMGFPFCTQKLKKKDYILYDDKRQRYEFTNEEFLIIVQEKILMMQRLELPEFIFVNCLKDERLPIEKVKENKVRLFMLCPFDLTLIVRMYFGSFIDHIHKQIMELGVCVGITPQSMQWHELARALQKHSRKFIAIDFSNWDRSIPYEFLEVFFKLADLYYNDEHVNIRYVIRNAILNPVYQLNWFRYTVQSGNPSGCPVTTELNSVANLAMTLYVLSNLGSEFMDVFNNTFVATYGDDSVISTAIPVDIEQLGEEIRKLGLIATSSVKTQPIQLQTIEEVIFLKRNFVFHGGYYHAPLLEDTITEMLLWVKRGPNQMANFQSTITNAMAELQEYPPQQVTARYYKLMNFCYRCNYEFPMSEHAYQSLSFFRMGDSESCTNTNYAENAIIFIFRSLWNLFGLTKTPIIFEDLEDLEGPIKYVGIDAGARLPIVQNRVFYHVGFRFLVKNKLVEMTFSDRGVCFIEPAYTPDFEYVVKIDLNKVKDSIDNPIKYDLVRYNCIAWCEEMLVTKIPKPHNDLFPLLAEKTLLDNTWLYKNQSDDLTENSCSEGFRYMPAQQACSRQQTRSLDKLLGSDVLLSTFNWGTSDIRGKEFVINFPKVLFESDQIAIKIKYNTYIKFDIEITIDITDSVALCGALLITWIPNANEGLPTSQRTTLHQFSGMNHSILSVPGQTCMKMTVPFNNSKNFICVNNYDDNEFGTLYMTVLSPLLTATGATNDKVAVMVYGNLTNVQLIIPTPLTAQSTWSEATGSYPLVLKKQADEQEEKSSEGIISGPTAKLASFANLVAGIPVISGVASTVSVISNTVSTVAEAMGLSKPRNLQSTQFVMQRVFSNVGYADAQDNGQVLGLSPKNHVVIQPSLFGDSADQMNIAYLIRRPSMLFQTHWGIEHTSGTTLFKFPIHPYIGAKGVTDKVQHIDMSHMGYLASCFTYWRGTIRIKLQIFSTSLHAGSLIVGFIPKGSWPDIKQFDYETTIKYKIKLEKTETVTEQVIDIPFISSKMMNKLKDPFSQIDLEEDIATGMLIIKVEKPLLANALVSDKLYINIWASAGEDFDLSLPNLAKLTKYAYGFSTERQSDEPLQTTVPQRFDLVMGERILNLRQLLKISVMKFSSRVDLRPGFNQIDFPAHSFDGSLELHENHHTYYNHFMRLYRYSRGSIRHKIICKSFEGKISAIVAPNSDEQYKWSVDHTLEGAPWCTTHAKLAPFLEYEIPFYSMIKMQVHGEYASDRCATVQFLNFENKSVINRVHLYESIGDDFSAGYLMGVPRLYKRPTGLDLFVRYVREAVKLKTNALIDGHYKYGDYSKVKGTILTTPHYSRMLAQQFYYTSYMHKFTLLIAQGNNDANLKLTLSDVNTTGYVNSFYFCFIDRDFGNITSSQYTWDSSKGYNGVWFYAHLGGDIYISPMMDTHTSGSRVSTPAALHSIRKAHPQEDITNVIFKLLDDWPFKASYSLDYE